jgi:iron complex transport system ATP-binding protein
MSQQPELHFPLSVAEIVMFGRYPHFSYKPSKNDEMICRKAMHKMEMEDMADRDYLTLSGGEKQRTQFARVLAQIWEAKEGEQKMLFLDEAISHLDLKHQHQVLLMAKEFCRRQATVIAILHDLNLAMHYADRMLLMKEGRIVYELPEHGKLTPAMIKDVFEVETAIMYTDTGKPVLVF